MIFVAFPRKCSHQTEHRLKMGASKLKLLTVVTMEALARLNAEERRPEIEESCPYSDIVEEESNESNWLSRSAKKESLFDDRGISVTILGCEALCSDGLSAQASVWRSWAIVALHLNRK
jgi:hypothetical protein